MKLKLMILSMSFISPLIFSLSLSLILPGAASAWGGRGHHTICEAAVFLVQDKTLRASLQQKTHMMGHLCNVPDFHWRNLGPEVGKQGNATHFVDVEILGLKVKDIPLDYQQLIKDYTGQKNPFKEGATIFSVPTEFGSNWWRADQFFRRAVALKDEWKKATPPANSKEEQDENLPYNKSVFQFYVNLGIMGHFVGDNSQPLHITADYDGYKAGHGGIHAYYEDSIVGALPYDLTTKVVDAGRKLQKMATSKNKENLKKTSFLNEKAVVEKMRALAELSFADIQPVFKLDPVIKPSVNKSEKGMSLRTEAERAPAETVAPKFESLVVNHMARSATLLAQLWDEAYAQVDRPKLAAYKNYKFPMTPDFVPPDYFDLKDLDRKKDK